MTLARLARTIFSSMAIALALAIPAHPATLTVAGDANIFGAGHSTPPNPGGGSGGTLPTSVSFRAAPGQVLKLGSVSGLTSLSSGLVLNGPDGNTLSPSSLDSFGGISGIKGNSSGFLVGVFLAPAEPADPAPPVLDFRTSSPGTSFASLSPLIGQTFFIGDGLTGTGSGAVQVFFVPATATRLYLGFADGNGYSGPPGQYQDNGGSLTASLVIALDTCGNGVLDPGEECDDGNQITGDGCDDNCALGAKVVGTGTAASCTDAAFNAALADGGLVAFNCGGPATIDISTGTGTKTISADTTIDGGSLITISGGNSVRVFSVNAGVTFTVQNLTIAGGNSVIAGGVSNAGTLTVTNSTLSGNWAIGGGESYGGGIYNTGTLTATNSTFSSNGASHCGAYCNAISGGIANNGGTLTVSNSTFSGNSGDGGGIVTISQAPVTVTNSTFSGNSGGGISNYYGPLLVTNSTFSGNSAPNGAYGGGIYNGGTATVTNTIVANSPSGGNCYGSVTDGGHNLDSDGTCGVGPATAPMLAAGLANNGGPTQTIALLAGSPAINAGDPEVCANLPVDGVDQRGFGRPGTGATNCAIGAYEYRSTGPPPRCIGDCSHDGAVTIDELITLVNIALGSAEMNTCPAGNWNRDAEISIDEILLAVNAALSSCPLGPGPPAVTIESYPAVDGSTSTLPLARLIACELLGLPYRWQPGIGPEGEAEIVPVATTPAEDALAAQVLQRIVFNKTHQAYVNLVDGVADLITVANPPSPEERAYADQRGVALVWEPLALDALVIVVNASNSVRGLTTEQVQRIYMGELTNWSDVGGAASEIHPYVRPENSGSQQLFNAIVMQGRTMPTWPPDRQIIFMGGLIDKIRTDELSIGYSVYYWVTYQYPSAGYSVVAVDGIAPAADTIGARSYPFTAEVWIVTRADLDEGSLAHQLHDWMLSPDGQQAVGRSGYVPIVR